MKTNVLPLPANLDREFSNNDLLCRCKTRWTLTGSLSALSGLFLGASGLILSLTARFETGEYHFLNSRLGGFLLLAMFPMFFLAAHALDRIAFYQQAIKENSVFCRNSSTHNSMKTILILTAIMMLSAFSAQAQQTIFNVPTTDVLGKGKVYVELDASFKPNDENTVRKFSSFTPRIVVGIGGKTEIGLNVTGNIQPGADSTTIVPTVKWKFYENEKSKTALIAGTNFYVPVRNRAYKFGSYSYLAASKTVKNTRLTAGGYVASKNVFAPKAVRVGGQFGIEQTVNAKLSFAADWITGKHASGYFTPGVIYKPHPKITAYFSYSIGNTGVRQGNHFFLFELGYNFD